MAKRFFKSIRRAFMEGSHFLKNKLAEYYEYYKIYFSKAPFFRKDSPKKKEIFHYLLFPI